MRLSPTSCEGLKKTALYPDKQAENFSYSIKSAAEEVFNIMG
jgi:hypothetical protein